MGKEEKKVKSVDISDVLDIALKGKCILFLGAGVHFKPPQNSKYKYPEEQRPPLGKKISEDLANELNFSEHFPEQDTNNLQRISLAYELLKGRKALVDRIKDAVQTNKKPSPVLKALAELDFPIVGMTNYDRLFEIALYNAGKTPSISIYKKDRNAKTKDYSLDPPDPTQPFIFKIHGDIDKAESIVITDEDYIDFLMRMSDKGIYNPIPDAFLYYFKKWPTLFIGYSLIDYNLRLLFKTLRWIGDPADIPRSYSVDLYPDDLIYKIYSERSNFVQFIVEDVWSFVPELYRHIKGREMP